MFARDHELHTRRWSRNLGVGLCLVAFAFLMFGLTVAKVTGGDPMQGFDHVMQPEILPEVLSTEDGQ